MELKEIVSPAAKTLLDNKMSVPISPSITATLPPDLYILNHVAVPWSVREALVTKLAVTVSTPLAAVPNVAVPVSEPIAVVGAAAGEAALGAM